jgi:hypothetical protein
VKTRVARAHFSGFSILVQTAAQHPPRLGVAVIRYSSRRAIVHDLDSLVTSPMGVH